MKQKMQLWILVALFVFGLKLLDRYFNKYNDGFCEYHLYSTLETDPKWSIHDGTSFTQEQLDSILMQPFTYLGKGHQSYVFESKDQKYIFKCYHFPSNLRPFSLFHHPFSKHSDKRRKIESYNLDKLHYSLRSYAIAFNDWKEESALVMAHLCKTDVIHKQITLIDALGHRHLISLDKVHFVIQKKGALLLTQLDTFIKNKQYAKAQDLVEKTLLFLKDRSLKGILDTDAMLDKNYGWIEGKPFQLDIGRLEYSERIKDPKETKRNILIITECLKNWLQANAPQLVSYYDRCIENI